MSVSGKRNSNDTNMMKLHENDGETAPKENSVVSDDPL